MLRTVAAPSGVDDDLRQLEALLARVGEARGLDSPARDRLWTTTIGHLRREEDAAAQRRLFHSLRGGRQP
jgi:hypothetical protein